MLIINMLIAHLTFSYSCCYVADHKATEFDNYIANVSNSTCDYPQKAISSERILPFARLKHTYNFYRARGHDYLNSFVRAYRKLLFSRKSKIRDSFTRVYNIFIIL